MDSRVFTVGTIGWLVRHTGGRCKVSIGVLSLATVRTWGGTGGGGTWVFRVAGNWGAGGIGRNGKVRLGCVRCKGGKYVGMMWEGGIGDWGC